MADREDKSIEDIIKQAVDRGFTLVLGKDLRVNVGKEKDLSFDIGKKKGPGLRVGFDKEYRPEVKVYGDTALP
ncbi:MAG: hypothetical protein IJJ48_08165, partial [Firmicutes bacterium]|nr:hypothetical protein [Bacillota bacterium]